MPAELLLEKSQVPVTALCSISGIWLSADGPFLRLYDQFQTLIKSHRIFDSQAIHGIKVSQDVPDQAIIWGGTWLRTVDVARLASSALASPKEVLGKLLRANDWILDIAIRPAENDPNANQDIQVVAITAHNDLLAFNFSGGTQVLATGSQCILYCADLVWISSSRLLIGSGSVFGEIIVWTYSWEDAGAVPRTHHIFTGHEGSIFGIRISQSLRSHKDENFRILSSCSDDRTIRVWDVSDLSEEVGKDVTSHFDTGFSPSPMDSMDLLHNHRCLASAMGHASRIWRLRYIYPLGSTFDEDSPILRIVSVGEDATCQSWDFKDMSRSGSEAKVYALQHANSEVWHSGKNIWSIHVPEQAVKDCFQVLSGGADGRIVIRQSTTNGPTGKPGNCQEWASADVSGSSTTNTDQLWAPSKPRAKLKLSGADVRECFSSVTFIEHGQLLAILDSGLVCVSSCVDTADKSSPSKWHRLGQFDGLRGFSVAASTADGSFAFFAGYAGVIYCFDHRGGTIYDISKIEGKVAALFAEVSASENGYCVSLVAAYTYLGKPLAKAMLLKWSIAGRLEASHQWLIESLTSFVTSATWATPQNGLCLILGCRKGSIHLLTAPILHPELHPASTPLSPLQLIASAHGKEAVTGVRWIKELSGEQDALGCLLSVGRDGACCVHLLSKLPKNTLLVHRLNLPFGPRVEGLWLNPLTSNLFIYGFQGTRFVFYNLTASVEVMTVDCGGAHRTWTFQPNLTPSGGEMGGNFAWKQATKLKSFSATNSAYENIQTGSHGREITACSCAQVSLPGSVIGPLIATGAEDTDIRLLLSSNDGARRLECFTTLKKHDTGIQQLEWSNDGRYLFSSGGAEAFFIWRLRVIPIIGIGVVCEAVCPVENIKSELRIMAFVVEDLLPQTNDKPRKECEAEFLITLVRSNSTVKTFRYTSIRGAGYWTNIATGSYTSACLTHISYISNRDKIFLLTASTDGHLVVWDMPTSDPAGTPSNYSHVPEARHTVLCIKRLHQSSIKSCKVTKISQGTFMVATGGDDNALGLSLIRFQDADGNSSSSITIESLLIPHAHSAAIGAISIIPQAQGHQRPERLSEYGVRVITSGNDQRVKLWSIHLPSLSAGLEDLEVRKVANEPTAVADIADLAILENNGASGHSIKVLICGIGMEIWTVTT